MGCSSSVAATTATVPAPHRDTTAGLQLRLPAAQSPARASAPFVPIAVGRPASLSPALLQVHHPLTVLAIPDGLAAARGSTGGAASFSSPSVTATTQHRADPTHRYLAWPDGVALAGAGPAAPVGIALTARVTCSGGAAITALLATAAGTLVTGSASGVVEARAADLALVRALSASLPGPVLTLAELTPGRVLVARGSGTIETVDVGPLATTATGRGAPHSTTARSGGSSTPTADSWTQEAGAIASCAVLSNSLVVLALTGGVLKAMPCDDSRHGDWSLVGPVVVACRSARDGELTDAVEAAVAASTVATTESAMPGTGVWSGSFQRMGPGPLGPRFDATPCEWAALCPLSCGALVAGTRHGTLVIWAPVYHTRLMVTCALDLDSVPAFRVACATEVLPAVIAVGGAGTVLTIVKINPRYLGAPHAGSSFASSDSLPARSHPNTHGGIFCAAVGHSGMVKSVVRVCDGVFVSGADDAEVRMWRLAVDLYARPVCMATLRGAGGAVLSLTQWNGCVVAGTGEGCLCMWRVDAAPGEAGEAR